MSQQTCPRRPGKLSQHTQLSPSEVLRAVQHGVDRYCPPSMRQEREDLAQSAVLRLLELCERRTRTQPLTRGYLSCVAQSVLIDEIRRRSRRPELSIDDSDRVVACGRPDPESQVRAAQVRRNVKSCMQAISPQRRRAIELYLEGHSVPECARELGCSNKQAENWVYRGRRDLQQRLRRTQG